MLETDSVDDALICLLRNACPVLDASCLWMCKDDQNAGELGGRP
jgi:hypothetical protein